MGVGTRATVSVPLDSLDFKTSTSGQSTPRRDLLAGLVSFGIFGPAGLRPAMAAAASTGITASSLIRPGDPIYGNPQGTVTIVDFYDIRCPPCRAMNLRIQKLLTADDSLRYVPIDYPILGPASVRGVKALFAAAMQGKYQALRAILMRQRQRPNMAVLEQDAKRAGIDVPRLELDMNGDRVAARIQRNLRRGRALGIHGIPTFFVGPERVTGGLSYDDLRAVVAQVQKSAINAGNS